MSLKETFPDKNIVCCNCENYHLVTGSFTTGFKYVNEQGTYYMFVAANSYWAPVQDIAIGKAVKGTVYLIQDGFPPTLGLNCIEKKTILRRKGTTLCREVIGVRFISGQVLSNSQSKQ